MKYFTFALAVMAAAIIGFGCASSARQTQRPTVETSPGEMANPVPNVRVFVPVTTP